MKNYAALRRCYRLRNIRYESIHPRCLISANRKSFDRTEEILIVDDELANLQLLTELLSDAGYRVRPTREPKLAIESALTQQPDVILLDVNMPEMDGYEVCRRLNDSMISSEIRNPGTSTFVFLLSQQ